MSNSALLILFTMAIVALVDYIPRAFLLVKKAIEPKVGYGRVPRYLIMPTVYGDISYLKNIDFLKKYADKVVICTSIYETPEFYRDLRKICQKYGFRYIRVDLPFANDKPIKNAYTIYKGALENLNRLGATKDTPCLLIDADTYAPKNVNNLVRTFVSQDIDIASLRCEVDNPQTTIEILQAYEYRLAMDNRRMDAWLTSGACNLGRAQVLQHVFTNHSNFFAGGDIEIGKLAQVMGYKIRHINFTFYTAAPNTVRDWFNQRTIWFAGGIRHHVTNIGSYGWHHFFLLFYNSLIVYLLFPLRWIEVVNFPAILLAIVALSWLYTAILVYGKGWKKEYLLLPAYGFVQSMLIIPFALKKYLTLSWNQRSWGHLHYDFKNVSLSHKALFKMLNIGSAFAVMYAAVVFTLSRLDYWVHHGTWFQSWLN